MSIRNFRGEEPQASPTVDPAKITLPYLQSKKHSTEPNRAISALTAYDYATARLADEAGIEMVLVGDSLAQVVLGYGSTLPVTVDEMLHHARAVRRGLKRALLVVDMPFGSYHASSEQALTNAIRFVKEGGAEAVKIEGPRATLVEQMVRAEIPVVAHLGLTPQSVNRMGGYRVQARSSQAAQQLLDDALALEGAGAAMVVLEGIPRELAERVTAALAVPTIGIGAGPGCDGQILVVHDLVGLSFAPAAKFVRRYADAAGVMREAMRRYREDVEQGRFPNDSESYHSEAARALKQA